MIKKFTIQFLVFSMILTLLPISKPNTVEASNNKEESAIIETAITNIHIADPYLEWEIRIELDKPTESITNEDMLQITGLSIDNSNILSLEGLQYARNLEVLKLEKNNISDLSPLQELEKLRVLNLSNNNVSNLSPLQKLSNLTDIDLSNNSITSLDVLINMPKLSYLDVESNAISDLTPIGNAVELNYLNVSHNHIANISNLIELTKLTYLSVLSNPINVFDLTNDNTSNNLVANGALVFGEDMTPVIFTDQVLESLVKEELNISSSKITKGDLTKLVGFKAINKGITDLQGLEHANNLSTLNINDNFIVNLEPLANLKLIQKITMKNNDITDLRALSNHTRLRDLNISDNRIRDLSPLTNLTSLKSLIIRNNGITSVQELGRLTNLNWLDLEDNDIDNVSGLIGLDKLEMLDLSNNSISSINDLTKLAIDFDDIKFTNTPASNESTLSDIKVVPPFKEWKITLSGMVDPKSLSAKSVYIMHNGIEHYTESELSSDGKTISIKAPENGYTPNEKYEIHISRKLKNTSGKYLDRSILQEFKISDEEVRNTQNVVVEPKISERKLLKFANLAYLDLYKDHSKGSDWSLRNIIGEDLDAQKQLTNIMEKSQDYQLYYKDSLNQKDYVTRSFDEIMDWSLIELEADTDTSSGFDGMAFVNRDHSQIVIAYRGSETNEFINDWVSTNVGGNFLQFGSQQIIDAQAVYKDAVGQYPNAEVFITGHSLGGWLAQRIAADAIEDPTVTKFSKAVTFNAPGFLKPGMVPKSINPIKNLYNLLYGTDTAKSYLSNVQWKNRNSADYMNKIDNIYLEQDNIVGDNFQVHLGRDILFMSTTSPFNWGTFKYHAISNFYQTRAYLSDTAFRDLGYTDTTIIRDLWKSDKNTWDKLLKSDSDYLALPLKYNKYTDLYISDRIDTVSIMPEKKYLIKIPEQYTSLDSIIINPVVLTGNVTVKIEKNNLILSDVFNKTYSENDGENIVISLGDEIQAGEQYILTITARTNNILKLKVGTDTPGYVTGKVTDSMTGSGSGDTEIVVYETEDLDGDIIASTISDARGMYSLNLAAGKYYITIRKDGYFEKSIIVESLGNYLTSSNNNISITPVVTNGEIRIVLEWGQLPADLDSYLTGIVNETEASFEVYYGNKNYYNAGVLEASLDVDDTSSFGPETITLEPNSEGVYRFYVHDYTNRNNSRDSMTLANSGATVRVINEYGVEKIFNVPNNKPGTFWNVFEIENNIIKPINSMSFERPVLQNRSVQDQSDSELKYPIKDNM